jgi:four helix bundle protein
MQDFRNHKVWHKSHELTLNVYSVTRSFPRSEVFALTTQMRKSSSSVPSLIADGCGRGSDADFARLLQMAMGSASEIEYQLRLSRDLTYMDDGSYEKLDFLAVEVKRMLAALLARLQGKGGLIADS